MMLLNKSKTLLQAVLSCSLLLLSGGQAFSSCSETPVPGIDWSDCQKRNIILRDRDLSRAKMQGTNFTSTDLSGSTLNQTDFTKANITRSNLDNVKATNAIFRKVVGNRTSMAGATISNSSFEKAEMQRTDFQTAKLSDVSFAKAEIGRSDFTAARIGNVDFSYANLARANFQNVTFFGSQNLEGAYMFQTRLEGVDLSTFNNLSQWQIDMSCGNEKTVLPGGVSKPDNWPCVEDE